MMDCLWVVGEYLGHDTIGAIVGIKAGRWYDALIVR